ncbi:hypothetical protein MMC27_000207 [Xylographa pallens]|nr:hypothetical protein [Xylographa pallens]
MPLPHNPNPLSKALSRFLTTFHPRANMFSTKPHPSTPLRHPSLGGTLLGVQYERDGVAVTQFRGVRYAAVARRFARPRRVEGLQGGVGDCREYGPICPQNHVDIRRLLRIPDQYEDEIEKEDELDCANLVVTLPTEASKVGDGRKLPVMIWIHGGSQVVSFGSPASRCCDPSLLVATSVKLGKPMIVVSPNYRLNIFAFGARTGEKNLSLQDQRCAIDWVVEHIAGFGGDESNITLAGSSAGGVYVHAHTFLAAPVQRAILMSGSLYLSPPQPTERNEAFLAPLEKLVHEDSGTSLEESPVESLLKGLKTLNVNSMWLRETPELKDWRDRMEDVEALMVGDVEYESILWHNGLAALPHADVHSLTSGLHPSLAEEYALHPSSASPPHLSALSLISTHLFHHPTYCIAARSRLKKPTYQYLIDEPNPFSPTSRAHHGVDLIYLFGGYDLSEWSEAENAGKAMRVAWVKFVYGEEPWDREGCMAFGPSGKCAVLDLKGEEWKERRKGRAMDLMGEHEGVPGVVGGLVRGRISLDN